MESNKGEYRQDNYSNWITQLQFQIQEIWIKQNEQKNRSLQLVTIGHKFHQFCFQKSKQDTSTINGIYGKLFSQNSLSLEKANIQLKEYKEELHHCTIVTGRLYEAYGNELFYFTKFFKANEQLVGELRLIHEDYCHEINQYKNALAKNLSLYKSKHERRTQIRKLIRNALSKLSQIKEKDMIAKYGNTIEKFEVKIDKKDVKMTTLEHKIQKKIQEIASLEEFKNEITLQKIQDQSKCDDDKQKIDIFLEQYKKQQELVNRMNHNLSFQCQELQKKFTPKLLKLYEYESLGIQQNHYVISEPQSVAIHGNTALSCVNGEQLIQWQLQEDQWKLEVQIVEKQKILSICLFDNGKQIFGGLEDGTIGLWNQNQGKWILIQTEQQHQRGIKTINVNNINTLMVSGSDDGNAKVWQYINNKWEVIQVLQGHKFGVFCAQFNRDSTIIGTGSFDNTIILWQFKNEDYQQHQIIQAHNGFVTSLCFSKVKDLLVSGSNDKCVKIWEAELNGVYKKRATLYDHKGSVNSVVFNSDSSILITGSQDGCVKFWRQSLNFNWVIYQEFKTDYMINSMGISSDDQNVIIGTLNATTWFFKSLDKWE